ncbi:hypothetical protein vseg_007812 [Gypsophila vaccaria]
MQKSTIFYIFITILLYTTTIRVSSAHRPKLVGGKMEVKDVKNNKEVQELGKFSVQEYNNNLLDNPIRDVVGRAGPLRFIEVVEAQRQVVAGLKYYLKVVAMQSHDSGPRKTTFDAVVVVKPWVESKQLVHFGPTGR